LLVPVGGVRRYLGDTFYGGSEWILLASTFGWVSLALGDRDTAHRMLAWIESAATDEGYLPEQVQDRVQSPYMLAHWRRKWGSTATPLLWSHAMHIVLTDQLNN
jgi:GH15 family glucan-1,4-alpha-glucosidase